MQESPHFFLRSIGLKLNLSTNPVGTFFGNGFLFQLVAKLHFKVRSVQVALTVEFRNKELPLFFLRLVLDKGWRSKDKTQLINIFKFVLQSFICIDGEGCSSNRYS